MEHDYLKSILNYNPGNGVFTWAVCKTWKIRIGDVAGHVLEKGYLVIGIDGKIYMAHRLSWFYVYGRWPVNEIDHINGNRADNRIINLREATHKQNMQNMRKHPSHNKTGLLGVYFDKNAGKFAAQIKLNGKSKHLGLFIDKYEAHDAYLNAKREIHEFSTI